MIVPLTREIFEQLIPLVATGPQYAYYWGDWRNLLKQLLISFVAVVVCLLLGLVFGEAGRALTLILCLITGLYWLWGPIYWASLRNAAYRRYPYSGFLRGQVRDVFLSEELIGEEETVDKLGRLVIIENRERRINVEIGDETGFNALVQGPLRRVHKAIAPGQGVELLVLSNQPDLARIVKITDVFIPRLNLWVGDYPYLQREAFVSVSQELNNPEKSRRRPPRRRYGDRA
ncbi:MAG: phosphate ABC transporter permease [Chloroflexaceae bacterium]|nr:phosphate ABC transporter permease [Chloroflexaceae bacterium]